MEKIVNKEPNVSYFHKIFSDEECDRVLNVCNNNFIRSLGYNHEMKKSNETDWRTSSSFEDKNNDLKFHTEKIYNLIRDKFWYIQNFNFGCLERPQVLKYDVGQEYKTHHDYFNYPNKFVSDNDRIATVIVYLNDDFEGGETFFPHLNVRVKPIKGSAIFFEYKYIRELNEMTLHAGLPVTSGTKYIATTWIRPNEFTMKDSVI